MRFGRSRFDRAIVASSHGETPNEAQVNRFLDVCREFINTNPDDIIGTEDLPSIHRSVIVLLGIHCTHGFNRSGFLICSFLYREYDMSIDAAIDLFSKARPPGIYKQDYLNELVRLYPYDGPPIIPAPERPEWCLSTIETEEERDYCSLSLSF